MAKKKAAAQPKTLRIKLVRSMIGYKQDQRDTVKSLGLRKINQVVEVQDIPAMRGMINKVIHLLTVEEVE
jgi:large subunit ribosomal protein L30